MTDAGNLQRASESVHHAVSATIVGFYRALDLRLDGAERFFAVDGQWMRGGVLLDGPAAICAALAARDPARVSCHLIHNMQVLTLGADQARAQYFVAVYEGVAEAPLRMVLILLAEDRLVRSAEGWKIQHKQGRRHLPAATDGS